MSDYQKIANCVVEGDDEAIGELIQNCLDEGCEALDILNNAVISGMGEVSELFKNNEICLPEVMMSAEAMYAGIGVIRPHLGNIELANKGVVVIGTVEGDVHDIGKNLVAMMLEVNGYKVINLGNDVCAEKYVQAVKEHHPVIVGMSALLTTSMTKMGEIIQALEKENLRSNIKIIIGGAPTSRDFCARITADGYSPDAASAVELCNQLLSK